MRGALLGSIVVLVTGCVGSASTTCGNLICPAGTSCSPNRTECVDTALLTSCRGAGDGATCSVAGLPPSTCLAGVCQAFVDDAGVAITDGAAPVIDAPPPLTASQLVVHYDDLYCDAAFACRSNFPSSATEFQTDFGTSAADCYQLAASADLPAVVDADAASSAIHFDPVEAATCLAGLGYDCSTFWQDGPTGQTPCEAAILGTIPDGGTCNTAWECSSWDSDCSSQTHTCGPS